jgi:hypothetical protein
MMFLLGFGMAFSSIYASAPISALRQSARLPGSVANIRYFILSLHQGDAALTVPADCGESAGITY